jgi:RimJ/RimL family protein N-acetyltransferase
VGFVLRPFGRADIAPDRAAVDDPSSARWVNTVPSDDDESLLRGLESEREAGRMLTLTIADPVDDRYLGAIVLFKRENDIGEIAYVVAPSERGRGLASEAVSAVGDWAFEALGLARLQLRIDPENDASHRVAERAGYQREGVLRAAFVVRGRRADVVMYSRLPGDP